MGLSIIIAAVSTAASVASIFVQVQQSGEQKAAVQRQAEASKQALSLRVLRQTQALQRNKRQAIALNLAQSSGFSNNSALNSSVGSLQQSFNNNIGILNQDLGTSLNSINQDLSATKSNINSNLTNNLLNTIGNTVGNLTALSPSKSKGTA